MLLSTPIIATLLQYQAFTDHETKMVAIALAVYSIGLPGFVLVKILAPGFYARQDTATPVKIGITAIGANIALYAILVVPWILLDGPAPHAALAFCAAISSFVNAGLLFRTLKKLGVYKPGKEWLAILTRIGLSCAAMAAVLVMLTPDAAHWEGWSVSKRGSVLAGLIGVAVVSYLTSLWALGIRPRTFLAQQ